jgi:hypothetical protein
VSLDCHPLQPRKMESDRGHMSRGMDVDMAGSSPAWPAALLVARAPLGFNVDLAHRCAAA